MKGGVNNVELKALTPVKARAKCRRIDKCVLESFEAMELLFRNQETRIQTLTVTSATVTEISVVLLSPSINISRLSSYCSHCSYYSLGLRIPRF